jgi:membrane protease YdiL (CAAX protease family)
MAWMTTALEARPPVRAARPLRLRLTLFAVTILAASNVVSNRIWPEGYVVWNVAVTALLVAGARASGLTWHDLGLHGLRLRRAALLGGAVAGSVAVAYAIAVAMPVTRSAFLDARAAGPLGAALFAALVRIPLGTALLEETAFRGVLPALVGGGWWRATLVSSALFGLWHVLPAIGMSTANAAFGAAFGGWGAIAEVTVAVGFTFAAGVWLCALRRWGGHLVTPVLAHVATNSLGVLIAWWMITHG